MKIRRLTSAVAAVVAVGLLGLTQAGPADAALPTGGAIRDGSKDVTVYHKHKRNQWVDISSISAQTAGRKYTFRIDVAQVSAGQFGNPTIDQNLNLTFKTDETWYSVYGRTFAGAGYSMYKLEEGRWRRLGGLCQGDFGPAGAHSYQVSMTKYCFGGSRENRILKLGGTVSQTADSPDFDQRRIFAIDSAGGDVKIKINHPYR